ncbi:MAG: T9SS type A sorting domain-containing protein [Bacteroidetes bacterium]|nr:T9SS type A sorting domain-containing protein [Bacteroidota bacterium]MCH8035065.1 T9SS type A sorting domain-containing protein [Bacteroidota bacterium]
MRFSDTLNYSPEIEFDMYEPIKFSLFQNYSNPFNPSTTIKFALPEKTDLVIAVYNSLGEKVAEAFKGELEEGYHEVVFSAIGGSASGGNASSLPSGVYFYRFESQSFTAVKKMIIMK